jgi:hypothetical protein
MTDFQIPMTNLKIPISVGGLSPKSFALFTQGVSLRAKRSNLLTMQARLLRRCPFAALRASAPRNDIGRRFISAKAPVCKICKTTVSPKRRDFLLGAVIFIGALALYGRTLAPSVATIFDDSLEFQLVCPTLGIAHPTGYPLYTLLGKLFTLIPIGDAAYRVNWMSALFAALTVVVTYLIVRMLTDHSLAAVFASSVLAVSPVFWSQAVIAEVYALNAFFAALVIYLLLRWEADHRQRPGVGQVSIPAIPNLLLLVAFVYGLSLTHHRLMLLLAPAVVLFAWLTERRIFTDLRLVSKLILFFLAPLLLYAYIPLRGLYTSSLDGSYQNTWSGFLRHVTASGYNVFITGNPLAQNRPLSFYWQLLVSQFGLVGVALGLVGLFASIDKLPTCPTLREPSEASPQTDKTEHVILRSEATKNLVPQARNGMLRSAQHDSKILTYLSKIWLMKIPSPAALLGVAFALNAAFVLTYRVADIEVFAIPAFLLYAIWMGTGIDFLGGTLAKVFATFARVKAPAFCRLLLVALFLLQPLALLRDNYPELDLSQRWAVHDYGVDMLSQPLEGNAVVVGILGEITLLRYFQRTEGLRPEVATLVADRDEERLSALEDALAAGQAVYVTRPIHGLPERYSLSALGPLIRVRAVPTAVVPTFQHPLAIDLAGSLRLPGCDTTVMSPHRQTTVRLTLYWQVLAPVGADYKVSARLLDGEGNQTAQMDDVPVHNTYPTSRWKVGETIADVYDLAVPPGTPPGQYRLLVILYQPDTLAEVGRAELGTVQLKSRRDAL